MKIDSHQHFWKYDPVNFAWIDSSMYKIQVDFMPQHLEPVLEKNGFDGCVLVQVNQTEEENHFFHDLALQHDFIKGVVGWVDIKSPVLEEKLICYKGFEKLRGFRHIVQGEPVGFMQNDHFISGLKKLANYNFTYDILIFPTQMKDALYVLRHCSGNKFVIDHLAKPYIKTGKITQWANYMKKLAEFPNVYCKVSGMVTEADWYKWKKEDFFIYLDTVFECFGPHRLMYGSDWPVCLVAAEYEEQLDIVSSYFGKLSESEKAGIFGDNAARFYGL
jgi:L-fuconolactonase